MPYDVETPAVRYNTDVTREHYGKYRNYKSGQTLFTKFSPFRGNDKDILEKTKFALAYSTFPGKSESLTLCI